MTSIDDDRRDKVAGAGRVSALPVPASISVEAQQVLAALPGAQEPAYPALEDAEGWLAYERERHEAVRPDIEALLPPPSAYEHTAATISGVPVAVLRPAHLATVDDLPIFLELHGGALHLGGGDLVTPAALPHARGREGITWAPDYRMPPRHPYPAALEDVLAVYRSALEQVGPERVVVSGISAGGNLAAAVLLRARDEGLPLPAALVLLTPEVDLTESGDSFAVLEGIDPVIASLRAPNLLYADGADLAHPYLSPLFGDLAGFPPVFLQAGTRDLFLSNTVRMHRALLRAGVEAELHVFEAMPHGGFGGAAPEDQELRAQARAFEVRQLAAAALR